MNKFLIMVATFVFMSAANASPSTTFAQRMESRFNAADSNHDGKLTLAEAQAGMPRVAQHFSEIDTAKKGYITYSQLRAFMAAKK